MKLGLTAGGFGAEVRLDLGLIQEAETLGYDSVWTAEAWGNDAIVPLAWIGAHTSRIKLGTGIMQMPARTPAMCAMQAMTLDALSGGRVIVGLGPSGPQVVEGWHGVPYGRPLTRTREYIEILRNIFAREEPVSYQGKEYRIPWDGEGATGLGKPLRTILHPRADIPVITATISPKAVALAAEVADGFMPIWTAPEGLESLREAMDRGFDRAEDKTRRDRFALLPLVNVCLGEDLQACRDKMKPHLALYVGGMGARSKNFYNDHVARQGWPDAAREIQNHFLEGRKREAAAAVPDDLVDAVCLVGPPERVRERLTAWSDAGVDTVILAGPLADDMRTVAELVS